VIVLLFFETKGFSHKHQILILCFPLTNKASVSYLQAA